MKKVYHEWHECTAKTYVDNDYIYIAEAGTVSVDGIPLSGIFHPKLLIDMLDNKTYKFYGEDGLTHVCDGSAIVRFKANISR